MWAYDYGAKPRRRWPAKHDTILVYVRDPDGYWFDADAVDREPYMAPGLVDAREGRARQAPDRRVVAHDRAHRRAASAPATRRRSRRGCCGGWCSRRAAPATVCADFFAGSGTLGAVAAATGRRYVLVDANPDAVAVMERRLGATRARAL